VQGGLVRSTRHTGGLARCGSRASATTARTRPRTRATSCRPSRAGHSYPSST